MSDVPRRPPRRSGSLSVPAVNTAPNPFFQGTLCVCMSLGSILLSTQNRHTALRTTKRRSSGRVRPRQTSNVRAMQAHTRSASTIPHRRRRLSIPLPTCAKIQSAHDVSGRRYGDGNNCRGTKRAGNIMHAARIDDAAPGYVARGVLTHLGPRSAATASVAGAVNIPPGSRTASSARQVDLKICVGAVTLCFFLQRQQRCLPPRIFSTAAGEIKPPPAPPREKVCRPPHVAVGFLPA